MKGDVVIIHFVLQILTLYSTYILAEPFNRTIVSAGHPFYKIFMNLGDCQKALLFEDQKIWTHQRLNRIMDIYYKSADPTMLVSRVEMQVVVNHTDCFGYSTTGVGLAEFIGALILPSNSGLVFYNLKIFTCNGTDYAPHCLKHMLQFYVNPKEIEELRFSNNRFDHEGNQDHHRLCNNESLVGETTKNPKVGT